MKHIIILPGSEFFIYWKDFLKTDGYVAVTYESWFTDERPAEIEKW